MSKRSTKHKLSSSAQEYRNKGVVLFIVLGMILVVTLLAGVVLSIISSQSRLTHHQASRIQAQYAAQAGVNYALEQLRTGAWTEGNSYTLPFDSDDFKPASIVDNRVSIAIRAPGSSGCINPPGNSSCVSVTATYTYTEP